MPIATLGFGDSAAPNQWTSAPNGALELIASPVDSTFAYDSSNLSGTSTLDQGYLITDVLSNIESTNSVSVQLRYGWATTFSNRTWTTLAARVMSGTTVLAAATSAGGFQTVASSITNTTPTNSSVVNFSYVNTSASVNEWLGADIELRIISTRSGGGSSVQRRVYAGQLVLDYNAVIPATLVKVWNGSTWQSGYLRRYDGSSWQFALAQRYDETLESWILEYGRPI